MAISALISRLGRMRRRAPRDIYKFGRGSYGEPKVLHWGEPATLQVGAFCSIAGEVTIFLGGEHRVDWITTYPFSVFWESAKGILGHPRTKGDVNVGNDVWIGDGATIFSGVTIGDGAVIGARSVVTRDVPPYGIVAGNPARLVRKRFTDEQITLLQRLAWWNWSDAAINAAMPWLLSGDIERLATFAADRANPGGPPAPEAPASR